MITRELAILKLRLELYWVETLIFAFKLYFDARDGALIMARGLGVSR